MKTVAIDQPYEIRVTDTEKPVPGEGEALLKVLYGGICGADVASYTGNTMALRFLLETKKLTESEKRAFLGENAAEFYDLKGLMPIRETPNML